MTHLAGLFLHIGALLLHTSSFGVKLVAHGRTVRPRAVSRRGHIGMRLAILPCHHPDQSDRGQDSRNRIGLYRIAQVTEELATAAFDIAQGGVNQLAGRQFVFKRVNNVADLGARLINLALKLVWILLRFGINLITCAHDVCPFTASLSLLTE